MTDPIGHDPKPYPVYRCRECGRALTPDPSDPSGYTHELTWQDRDRLDREARKAAQVARVTGAIRYTGAIQRCQASIPGKGRDMLSYRCGNRARFVVQRERWGGDDYPATGDPDTIAVCSTHAGRESSHRHFAHRWGNTRGEREAYRRNDGDAWELIEEEYRA